jgi:hypothetical protein
MNVALYKPPLPTVAVHRAPSEPEALTCELSNVKFQKRSGKLALQVKIDH